MCLLKSSHKNKLTEYSLGHSMMRHDQGAVAVVDDDPAVLDSLRFLIQIAGYDVAIYKSGPAFFEDSTSQPACIILDHHMPHMTGLEFVARLRAEARHIPILLITGAASAAIIARAAELGVEKVIDKPPSEEDLLSFIQAHHKVQAKSANS